MAPNVRKKKKFAVRSTNKTPRWGRYSPRKGQEKFKIALGKMQASKLADGIGGNKTDPKKKNVEPDRGPKWVGKPNRLHCEKEERVNIQKKKCGKKRKSRRSG